MYPTNQPKLNKTSRNEGKSAKGYTKPTQSIAKSTQNYAPSALSLTSEDLPEIKSWKVGEEYEVKMTIKQTSLSQGDKATATFEIVSVETEEPTYDQEYAKRMNIKSV